MELHFSSVQLLSHVQLFATPWTAACQASLSIANSQSLLKLMSIESVMPSNHLILCRPLLLLPSIFSSIRVFSNESALRIRWPKHCTKSNFIYVHIIFPNTMWTQTWSLPSLNFPFPLAHSTELDYKESWEPNNWCFWTVVLEKTLESPLDCKEIQPVHPRGNQSWIFIGRTDA